MTAAKRGRFITFEGGEGVGKSTQLSRLADHLRGSGLDVVATREPGGTPRAEALRKVALSGRIAPLGALAEAALFAAARLDHVEKLIAPALKRGAWVLCDRFADSTRAYQGARGGAAAQAIALLERAAVGETKPDLTIVIDAPPQEGLARAALRRDAAGQTADRFEAEDDGFHEELRRAFLDIAEREPGRCCVVNGSLPPDEVARAIRQLVEARFLDPQQAAAQ
ncbi:MAG: dTMP kinase [Methylocystis sp.]|nr:MAG: dTMP kinase [Methylocystis sp.]